MTTPYLVLSGEQIAGGLVLLAGAMGALTYIARKVREAVHIVDRLRELIGPMHKVTTYELTNNGGGSMKDKVEAALTTARAASDTAIATRALVQLVADEVAAHGRQSRAAMAIYRRALSDQGIHLPIAPGEGGYAEIEETST